MPHKNIVNSADFTPSTTDVFQRLATRYDLMCNLFSMGLHRLWKRRFVQIVQQESWQTLLDVASGTGDIALNILKADIRFKPKPDHFLPNTNTDKQQAPQLIVSDLSIEMLNLAQTKLHGYCSNVQFLPQDAHDMTDIATNSQNVVTISMGLKLLDRRLAFKEALRVLKPQGRLITMEVSSIPVSWLQRLYSLGMSLVIPIIAKVISAKDDTIYRYLLNGIKAMPTADKIAKEMINIGFKDVRFERLSMGVIAIHTGRKD